MIELRSSNWLLFGSRFLMFGSSLFKWFSSGSAWVVDFVRSEVGIFNGFCSEVVRKLIVHGGEVSFVLRFEFGTVSELVRAGYYLIGVSSVIKCS